VFYHSQVFCCGNEVIFSFICRRKKWLMSFRKEQSKHGRRMSRFHFFCLFLLQTGKLTKSSFWNSKSAAMSIPRPVGCMRPSRWFCPAQFRFQLQSALLTTSPYFDDLEFDIFDAISAHCHFISADTIAVRIRTLSEH